MKVTFAISVVAIFGLVGFMTDPVWEAMALWQRQVWILSMASAHLALMFLFCMYYAGLRPRNLKKEDELVKEQRTKNKVKRKKEKSSYEPKRKKKFNKKHPNRI